MMNAIHQCPTPEEMGVFSQGEASEREWRSITRHLSQCAVCRRTLLLLTAPEVPELVEAITLPGPLPLAPARGSSWSRALRAVAAAVVFAAMATAIVLMNRPQGAMIAESTAPSPCPPKSPRPGPSTPPSPESATTRLPEPESPPQPVAPTKARIYPPPPGFREDAPMAVPPRTDVEPSAGTSLLAARAARGVAEAIEVTAGGGGVSVVKDSAAVPMTGRTYLRPSDTLVSDRGGSVVLPDGSSIHLSAQSQIQVSWSQTLSCYSLELRKDVALVDLGAAPRAFHVARGSVGLRIQETSGKFLFSAQDDSLRAIALQGPAVFLTTSGARCSLRSREALTLTAERDTIGPSELSLEILGAVFPTARETPRVPAAPPRDPAPPDPGLLVRTLEAQGYDYRVSGRQLRDGSWLPSGILVSIIEDLTVATQERNPRQSHFQKGARAWDSAAGIRPGSREEKLLEGARRALPPHLLIQQALSAARAEPRKHAGGIAKPGTQAWEIPLDPQRIRAEFGTFLDQAVREGRLTRPDFISWETLEGSLEFTTTKEDARVIRFVDRRRVAYSYNTTGGFDRRWYELETVIEFSNHGHPSARIPPEILKDLDPSRK